MTNPPQRRSSRARRNQSRRPASTAHAAQPASRATLIADQSCAYTRDLYVAHHNYLTQAKNKESAIWR